jgi:CMP-N,N'-diacetyllegionaminic acid synthase
MNNKLVKVVAIIPARSGSKGIKDKNIRLVQGHPLIAYSIAAAKLSKYINKVIVSTDSKVILQISNDYQAETPFIRPENISKDSSLDIEFFKHYLDFCISSSTDIPDLIVHLRPTTPCREISIIEDAIEFMINNGNVDSLKTMHKINMVPYKLFKDIGGYAKPLLLKTNIKESYNYPRQFFEDSFLPNGLIDIIRPINVLEKGVLYGEKIKLLKTEKSIDIDREEDLELASYEMKQPKYEVLCEETNRLKSIGNKG